MSGATYRMRYSVDRLVVGSDGGGAISVALHDNYDAAKAECLMLNRQGFDGFTYEVWDDESGDVVFTP